MQNKQQQSSLLSPRLRAAADLVRGGAFISDVGTDHAYLPIALALEGKIRGAVASDINEGPYLCALRNVAANGLSKKITAKHTAGLCGIESYGPTDILICGMGGELIASIIDEAPWTKNKKIRLIVQPMTHPEILREYLIKNGFTITHETLVREEKIYQIFAAEYTGEADEYSEAELLLGRQNIKKGGEIFCDLVDRHIEVNKKILSSKRAGSGDADVSREEKMISMLEELKK